VTRAAGSIQGEAMSEQKPKALRDLEAGAAAQAALAESRERLAAQEERECARLAADLAAAKKQLEAMK